ncbi:MAG: hypothetical protein M0T74_17225 [Desulfitobacterium hafniense]|nr:hypothetical protein [Desulfitobacterium hafniense]
MNLKKKIFPLAMSVLMGVGAIGVANAASPFDYSQDVISGTQQQSNLGTQIQSSAEKPAPKVTITKTQTNMIKKTKSTLPQKSITRKTQSPKFQDRTSFNNTSRYQGVDYNNLINNKNYPNHVNYLNHDNSINYNNCYQNYKQQTGSWASGNNVNWRNGYNSQRQNRNCW